MTCFFYAPFSLSGTGRGCRVERPELSGSVPPGIRRTDKLSLWHGIGGASGSFGVTGGQGYDWKYGGTGNTYWGGINFYASRVTPVVGEIRPGNRAVRYLIRAR